MRIPIIFASICFWVCSLQAQSADSTQISPSLSVKGKVVVKPFEWPLQLELRVPFAPTVFKSGSGTYAVYELYLTNFGANSLPLTKIEVLNADVMSSTPLATFQSGQLKTMVQSLGISPAQASSTEISIAGGQCQTVFMFIALDAGAHWPNRLSHRVTSGESTVQGAEIVTHQDALHTLGAPVKGQAWLAADGPSNDEDNHHRRGVIVLDGRTIDSRRYAIDWKIVRDGMSFAGDPRDVRSYYSYDQPVLAVADGRVLVARDGLPNNVPGHGNDFHPAVPITLETVAGNAIVLDLGGGQFAYYLHLKPGSVMVKAGNQIHKGDVIAHIGGSGDAREPHLHFEVTDSATLLQGEGLPYLIDHFSVENQGNGLATSHRNELPAGGSVIDFE